MIYLYVSLFREGCDEAGPAVCTGDNWASGWIVILPVFFVVDKERSSTEPRVRWMGFVGRLERSNVVTYRYFGAEGDAPAC